MRDFSSVHQHVVDISSCSLQSVHAAEPNLQAQSGQAACASCSAIHADVLTSESATHAHWHKLEEEEEEEFTE